MQITLDEFRRALFQAFVFQADTLAFREDAAAEASNRKALTYFAATCTIAMMTLYWNMKNDALTDFFPAAGFLLCYVIMKLGASSFDEEAKITRQAIAFHEKNGMDGDAMRSRLERLVYTSPWQLSKVDFGSICVAAAWFVFGIGELATKS